MTVPLPPLPDRVARLLPPGATRARVPVGDGVHIHVQSWGEGRPVLMLHGNPTWGLLYREVVRQLADAPLRLVVPDLPGLGLSDRIPAAAHTLAHHGAWMAHLIEVLDLRDLVLVVADWGGPIGLRALSDQPHRLGALVVLNTVLGPPRPGFRPTAFHRFARVPVLSNVAFRLLGFPQRALWLAQADRTTMRGDVAWAYAWPLTDPRTNAAPLALARMVPDGPDHPSIPDLARCEALASGFHGPAAIVWGDRDPILGRARGRAERLLPHARVWRTDAGHFLQEEVPDVIAAAVRHVAGLAPVS